MHSFYSWLEEWKFSQTKIKSLWSAVKIIIKKHVFTRDINNTTTCCLSPSAQEKEWTQKQLYVQQLCDRRSQFVAIEAQQFRLRVQRMRWLKIHIGKHDEKTQCLRSTPSWECCQTSVWNRQRLISNTQRGPTSPPLIYSSGATVPRVGRTAFSPSHVSFTYHSLPAATASPVQHLTLACQRNERDFDDIWSKSKLNRSEARVKTGVTVCTAEVSLNRGTKSRTKQMKVPVNAYCHI